MKKIYLLIIFIFISTINLLSQNNYSKGYVVTFNKDTIHGEIKQTSNSEMYIKIYFKDALGNQSVLNTNTIISYKIDNDYYYRKMHPYSYDYYYFFKLKFDGKIKLYEFRKIPETIESGNISSEYSNVKSITTYFPNFENQNTIIFLEKDDLVKLVDGSRFKRQIKKFVKDDQEIIEKIVDKTYNESEIYSLVRKYNENYKKRNL
ncbi:MAG: hypothetical protein GQ564_14830 [Bacteroidales bacterium]|nr:hypothetical protein [Bacteroidales bacterium]